MAMSADEKREWELVRYAAMVSNNPTLTLLALEYWRDKINARRDDKDRIIHAELDKRKARSYWIDTNFVRHSGQHPYTIEQIIAEYRRINPL